MTPTRDNSSEMPGSNICNHGFQSHNFGYYGHFLARPYMVERVDGAQLRDMFVPTTTPAAEEMLRENKYFALGQLMHYGIAFKYDTPGERGIELLRQELIAGTCDRVPPCLEQLKLRLIEKWVASQSNDYFAQHCPERLLKRCFLDEDGRPAPLKKPDKVVVRAISTGKLQSALASVPELKYVKGDSQDGYETLTISWKDGLAYKELKPQLRAAKEAENALRKFQASLVGESIVGTYHIDCRKADRLISTVAESFTMVMIVKKLDESDSDGIYAGWVSFGVFVGIMLLSKDESKLDKYAKAHAWTNDEADEGDGTYRSDPDYAHPVCKPRLSSAATRLAQAVKSAVRGRRRTAAVPPPRSFSIYQLDRSDLADEGWDDSRDFHFLLRGHPYATHTWLNEFNPKISKGALRAEDNGFINFAGETRFPFHSLQGPFLFRAFKVSDSPEEFSEFWETFLAQAAWERERPELDSREAAERWWKLWDKE